MTKVPVLDLSRAPGKGQAWTRPKWLIYLWSVSEILFVTNPFQVSSMLRVWVLRLFGAKIGTGVIFRPRTRVKYPWNLQIGDRSWIGEGVWFHNQDNIYVESDVVISQETMLTTGSHAHRKDMALIIRPIHIHEGVWITSRCMILGGSIIGKSSIVTPHTVVNGTVPSGVIFGDKKPEVLSLRWKRNTSTPIAANLPQQTTKTSKSPVIE